MIGLIISGHGQFATGLQSSLELIAGPQANVKAVDFLADDSTGDLETKLKKALESLSECEGILILCDLVGGSPYKAAAALSVPEATIEVVGGANLAMIIESTFLSAIEPLSVLKERIIHSGREGIQLFELQAAVQADEETDGI